MSILILEESDRQQNRTIEFHFTLVPDLFEVQSRLRPARKGCGIPFTNAGEYIQFMTNELRKIIMSDIVCWAVDEVDIKINTSVLSNELIIHRLSFCPVNESITELLINRCWSDDLNIDVKLDQIGPGPIYTSSLILDGESDSVPISVLIPDGILCYLREGEKLSLRATLKPGTFRKNSKWAVVTVVEYEEVSSNTFRYKIESVGQLSPREILWQGLKILEERWNIRVDLTIKSSINFI